MSDACLLIGNSPYNKCNFKLLVFTTITLCQLYNAIDVILKHYILDGVLFTEAHEEIHIKEINMSTLLENVHQNNLDNYYYCIPFYSAENILLLVYKTCRVS